MNKNFAKAPYDIENATYRQFIKFVNGKSIDGYSKKVDFAEPVDANNCLTNFILRMYVLGYLRLGSKYDPIEYIAYQFNHTGNHIVTCYYDWPEINPDHIGNSRLVNWLKNFYADINLNKGSTYIQKKHYRRGREAYDHELDISRHAFLTPDHLIKKVQRLFQEGRFSVDQITHYYRQALQIYFPQVFQSGQKKKYDEYVLQMAQSLKADLT